MQLKNFLILNAFLFIPFGIMMLSIPNLVFPMLSVDLEADGLVMASTVGSMLLSFGIICWFARRGQLTDPNMKAILLGNLVFHSIDSFLTGKAAITGVMNQLGFVFSAMHLLLALGFLYFMRKSVVDN